jgi:membrane protease YdiL (CAAX protease family)
MITSSPLILAVWLCIGILIILWILFFIYSYRHKLVFPWGFSIVVVGVLVSGRGLAYHGSADKIVFSFDLMFIVCLFGILWNINNIREQFQDTNIRKVLFFIGIGLLLGSMFGLLFIIAQATKYIQTDARYTSVALTAIVIQSSLAEEILFRGYLLSYLRKYGFSQIPSIVLQSLIFTILHITRYSDNWIMSCVLFLFGITAGYFTLKNKNLGTALTMHAVNNLIGVVIG